MWAACGNSSENTYPTDTNIYVSITANPQLYLQCSVRCPTRKHLGPFLFINDLPSSMKHSKTFLFADDTNASGQFALHKTISYFSPILTYCPYGVLNGNCCSMRLNALSCQLSPMLLQTIVIPRLSISSTG